MPSYMAEDARPRGATREELGARGEAGNQASVAEGSLIVSAVPCIASSGGPRRGNALMPPSRAPDMMMAARIRGSEKRRS